MALVLGEAMTFPRVLTFSFDDSWAFDSPPFICLLPPLLLCQESQIMHSLQQNMASTTPGISAMPMSVSEPVLDAEETDKGSRTLEGI